MVEIIIIHNRDFRETLEEDLEKIKGNKVIITDPPYNIGYEYNQYKDDLTEEEYQLLISHFKGHPLAIIHYPEETMKYFVPALGVPDEVNVWAYNSNLPSRHHRLINYYHVLPDYNKVKQPYKNPNDKRIRERIKNGSKGARSYDWFSDIQMVKNVSKGDYPHPCPVPVELMERIIKLTTNEGDTIIDPFMGSGTTGIACLNTNRNFIGYEIDGLYFNMADERLHKHKQELDRRMN